MNKTSKVIKFETVANFLHGGPFNQDKSMIFWQFASIAGNVRSFMLAQKYRPRIPELWPKFTFLLKQQIKFILISVSLRATPLTIFEGWGGLPVYDLSGRATHFGYKVWN